MSKLLLVAVTATVLLMTPQAAPASTSVANFKPGDDPYVLYEELKEVIKKVNPQLLARVNEEEKNFKHDRDTLSDEAKHFVDKVAVMYLEVTINTLKGQPPPQTDVYAMAGKLRFGIRDLSPQATGEINGSAFFRSLISGHQ